jgi:hypothetical protein
MGTYKITFVYNQIARISLATGEHNFKGKYYCHSKGKGFSIYAFVKEKSHLNDGNILVRSLVHNHTKIFI